MPALLLVIAFTLYPLGFSLLNSFKKFKLTAPNLTKYIGLQNYIDAFKNTEFVEALIRTLALTVIIVTIQLFLGIVFALILSKSFKGHGIVRSILILPLAATPIVVGLTWKLMFDPRVGVINYILSLIGIDGPIWLANTDTALLGIIIMQVWQWTPFIVVILLAGILGQDKGIHEAALVDGATNMQTIFKITLPLLNRVIGVAVLIRASDAFRLFDQVWMLTKGGPGTSTETLTVSIYRASFNYFDIGRASAYSFIMLIIMMIFFIFTVKRINLLEE